jgi:hypothetical protein
MMPRDINLIRLFFKILVTVRGDPGTLVFDLSKPAAIISFDSIAGKQSPDAAKIWEFGSKLFAQKALKKCYTGLNLREVVY